MAQKRARVVLVEYQNLRALMDCWETTAHHCPPLHSSLMNEKYTVGRAKTGPDLVPSDASTVFLSCTKPLLFPQFSYPSSLHNVFPIFQHEYIKYYKFIILWSSYLHDRQCKGLMDQFLRYINIHRNINTFSFSLWPTWLARFTNYVKWNNDSKEKCLINLVVSFILSCKVTCEFNLMLVWRTKL